MLRISVFRYFSFLLFIFLFSLSNPASSEEKTAPEVLLITNLGDIRLQLFQNKAPETVKNFLRYIESGTYKGTIFHRVIPNFMIQGGGYDINMNKRKTSRPVKNESKNRLSNIRGTIAMARTGDPHSATNQFFINLVDNRFLDAQGNKYGYAVFGKVIKGMDVVKKIGQVKTAAKGYLRDVPVTQIIIKDIRVLSDGGK